MNLFSIISIFILNFNSFHKCDCDEIIGFKEANHVFRGKVIDIKRIEEPFIRYEISLKLSKRMKGKLNGNIIVVNTPCLMTACCGIPFEVDKKYQIYTFIQNNLIYTGNCTMTRQLRK